MAMDENKVIAARDALISAGQEHILKFWDELDESQQRSLLGQIESVDWREVSRLVQTHVKEKPEFELPGNVEPAPWYPYHPPADLQGKYMMARRKGEELLREGKVAAFTVAGGQGTRLGWDAPKGTFPATPIRGLPLFGCLAEYILNAQKRYKQAIPWYVMTSPINDEPTRAFFEEQNHFGLDPKQIMIFPQAMMPAFDMKTGKVLMESKSSIALSPNGHGGSLKALYASGAIADMQKRGVEQISYTQIDNPIVRVVDPLFIGLHHIDGAQMSSKMLPKAYPKEKLGNFCLVDKRMTVIEYSDLPDELANQRTDDGELRFRAGSIALHVIRRDFVEQINKGDDFGLPFHRAEKKVPHIDLGSKEQIKPEQANAVKLETFVFDALPMCRKSIIYETDRIDEFAPIKNADAPEALDSPSTSKQIQIERAARWLESRGVHVERDEQDRVQPIIEISQVTAIYPQDLEGVKLPAAIHKSDKTLI